MCPEIETSCLAILLVLNAWKVMKFGVSPWIEFAVFWFLFDQRDTTAEANISANAKNKLKLIDAEMT